MASDSDNFKYRQSRGWTRPYALMRRRAPMNEQCAAIEGAFKKTVFQHETKRAIKAVGVLLAQVSENNQGILGFDGSDQFQSEFNSLLPVFQNAHAGDPLTPVICESALQAVSHWVEAGRPIDQKPIDFFVRIFDKEVKDHLCYAPIKGKVCEEAGMSVTEFDMTRDYLIKQTSIVTHELVHQAIASNGTAPVVERRIDHSVVGLHSVTLAQP